MAGSSDATHQEYFSDKTCNRGCLQLVQNFFSFNVKENVLNIVIIIIIVQSSSNTILFASHVILNIATHLRQD